MLMYWLENQPTLIAPTLELKTHPFGLLMVSTTSQAIPPGIVTITGINI